MRIWLMILQKLAKCVGVPTRQGERPTSSHKPCTRMVPRIFIKIFISFLRNLIILHCSMVATQEKNRDLNAEDCEPQVNYYLMQDYSRTIKIHSAAPQSKVNFTVDFIISSEPFTRSAITMHSWGIQCYLLNTPPKQKFWKHPLLKTRPAVNVLEKNNFIMTRDSQNNDL